MSRHRRLRRQLTISGPAWRHSEIVGVHIFTEEGWSGNPARRRPRASHRAAHRGLDRWLDALAETAARPN